jgi:hypothetical protein
MVREFSDGLHRLLITKKNLGLSVYDMHPHVIKNIREPLVRLSAAIYDSCREGLGNARIQKV